ncbi:Dolichyl-diphosphooligosaccharide-protein glycosyltransferase 48kDa subunit, partial [Ramicandelaber brevisporus]
SASGCRVLALFPTHSAKDQHFSTVFNRLTASGYNVTSSSATDSSLLLFDPQSDHERRLYDHLVLFAPKGGRSFGGQLAASKELLTFVNSGGNVVLAAGTDMADSIREFAAQVGVEFDDRNKYVIDHFNYNQNIDAGLHTYVSSGHKITYYGVGHIFAPSEMYPSATNPLYAPVLRAPSTAYSAETSERDPVTSQPWVAGSDIMLVSALQARNNARVVVAGSVEMFTDKLIDMDSSANGLFVEDVLSWTLQERGVLKATAALKHAKKPNVATNSVDLAYEVEDEMKTYRVKDVIDVSLAISEWRDGKWQPYIADDVQLDVAMLDPYIRTPLVHDGHFENGGDAAVYKVPNGVQLPDKHGVFTLRVNYKRHGVSYFEVKENIAARPFRHNEHPRYLSAAYPYYFSAASMLGGFVLFTAIWL